MSREPRNNDYEFIGRVLAVGDEETYPSGFRKRRLVVCDDAPKFPQEPEFEFTGDNVDKSGGYVPGDHVCIRFSVRGHEYNGRHFVTLRGYRIERAVKIGGEPRVGPAPQPQTAPQPATPVPTQQPLPGVAAPLPPAATPPAPPSPIQDSLEDLPF